MSEQTYFEDVEVGMELPLSRSRSRIENWSSTPGPPGITPKPITTLRQPRTGNGVRSSSTACSRRAASPRSPLISWARTV
jgi:hypothetical protein